MDVFVARQPIFDADAKVIAYELLFRSGPANAFDGTDPDRATSSVIVHTFLGIGLDELTEGRPAFINFTRDLLLEEYATLLPPDRIVVEVLEDIEPDARVIESLQALHQAGYTIALDDFVYAERFEPLLELADLVKVDFMQSGPDQRRDLARRFLPRGIDLLAEKVETRLEFEEAVALGYTSFQGYFFAKPVVVSAHEVPGFKLNYLRMLTEVNRHPMDFEKAERIIKQEVSLSWRLLRTVNSAMFRRRTPVDSLGHAMVMLGERGVAKWVSMLAMTQLGEDRPPALVETSIVRARFLELMAPHAGLEDRKEDLFLLGTFSMIDAIVGRPLAEVLAEIPLAKEVKDTLLGEDTPLSKAHRCMLAYERGDWEDFSRLALALGLDEDLIPKDYFEAVQWGRQVLDPDAGQDPDSQGSRR